MPGNPSLVCSRPSAEPWGGSISDEGEAPDMNSTMNSYDGTVNQGRKGIAYDWQSLYAATAVDQIDVALAALQPQFAE
jgi:hypothetical protein